MIKNRFAMAGFVRLGSETNVIGRVGVLLTLTLTSDPMGVLGLDYPSPTPAASFTYL